MGHHYWVVLWTIGYPAGRIDRLGYLVGVLRSRPARADVHELSDALRFAIQFTARARNRRFSPTLAGGNG